MTQEVQKTRIGLIIGEDLLTKEEVAIKIVYF